MKVDHELKITPDYFKEVLKGNKRAELRIDDRGFKTGDIVLLKEWKPKLKKFSGRGTHVKITHILRCGDLIPSAHNWIVFSFEEVK